MEGVAVKRRSARVHAFLRVSPGELDDEVVASVYENRGDVLDLDSLTQLTADSFHAAVARSRLTVVLFYLKCKTRSQDVDYVGKAPHTERALI